MKKKFAAVPEIYRKNKYSVGEIVKKEEEIHVSFAVAPHSTKSLATVRDNCLFIMESHYI
jgi:hypothetical protein